jgi:hypothetical protein
MWTNEERKKHEPTREERNAITKRYRDKNIVAHRAAWRKWNLKANYGLTEEDIAAMLQKQGGGCAICGTTTPGGRGRMHIDHDHNCCPEDHGCKKCIRGLLCHHCNTALGKFKDSVAILEKAIDYLKKGGV